MTESDPGYISISSSSSSESDESDHESDDYLNCISSSTDGGSALSDEEIDHESVEDDSDGSDDSEGSSGDKEAYCDKIVALLKEGKPIHALKLEECKAYLRKHGLRIAGTKETCIERIQEHWRIKDGNGEKLYPRSSFLINCTGDVCRGDVVLFRQRVYRKFDLARKGGDVIGKRTVAGRVVKESYGAAKQQHTFTVEVLWSKGPQSLPPLFPLLVKGRNLYRLKTFRQLWDDEVERHKVLAEKHKRGGEARLTRAIKRAQSANKGPNGDGNSRHTKAPPKERKPVRGPSREHKRENNGDFPLPRDACVTRGPERKAQEKTSSTSKRKKHTYPSTTNKRQKSHDPRVVFEEGNVGSTYAHLQRQRSYNPRVVFEGSRVGSTYAHLPPQSYGNFHPLTGYTGMCSSSRYNINSGSAPHPTAAPTFNYEPMRWRNNFSTGHAYPNVFDPRTLNHSISLRCSIPGCGGSATRDCVGCYCWKCCRKAGRRCLRHAY
ncbi:hypothetical protein H6P81_010813 [Aristolochia fimbriata]|uniref:SAP domain-containing protein n=1 Tax=Aristolochia fimbriata TaxID=158543 RepID=A0AAV7EPU2_ARIFI|nr:hypothetical protein H6P81_010813 [Aristolochia fimbriata]